MKRSRFLVPTAFVLAAGVLTAVAAGRGSAPVTIATASDTIDAFAQDAGYIAWVDQRYGGVCGSGAVEIETLATKQRRQLVTANGATCAQGNGSIGELAVAGNRVAWAFYYGSNESTDASVIGASLVGKSGKRGDIDLEDIYTVGGAVGNSPGFVVHLHGDGTAFVWAAPAQDDGAGDTTPPAVMSSVNGHVAAVHGLGTYPASLLGLSGDTVAVVHSPATASVDLRSLSTGKLERTIALNQFPDDLALGSEVLAVVTGGGSTITRLDPASGKLLGSSHVSGVDSIAASDTTVVFSRGDTISELDAAGHISTLATTSRPPVGLSIVGTRVAWADGKFVRAVMLTVVSSG